MADDVNTISKFITDHSVMGAVGTAVIAFLYKAIRILKSDKKEDDLGNAERELREEMRTEIKELRREYHELEQEKKKLLVELTKMQSELARVQAELNQLKSMLRNYRCDHMDSCPLLLFARDNENDDE